MKDKSARLIAKATSMNFYPLKMTIKMSNVKKKCYLNTKFLIVKVLINKKKR